MDPKIDLLSVIYLIGTAQGVFLVVALLSPNIVNKQANRYLAAFLFIFTLSLADEFLFRSRYFYDYHYLIGLIWPLDFLYGPLFFFYVRELTSINPSFSSKNSYLHWLLFFLGILLAAPTWVLEPNNKIALLYGLNQTMTSDFLRASIADGIATILVVIQIAVYLYLNFRNIQCYRERIRQKFSEIEKINLSWLTTLLLLLLSLWVLFVIDVFFSEIIGISYQVGVSLHVMLVLIIYGMGYMGLRQTTIFKMDQVSDISAKRNSLNTNAKGEKYSKSKLSEEQSDILKSRLLVLMEERRPYLENGITLPEMAGLMICTSNHLSQVINDRLEKTFFDFINSYRISYAKKRLLSHKREGVLDISMNSGFNSKSAFYTAFKKEVGMTPSQYRKIN